MNFFSFIHDYYSLIMVTYFNDIQLINYFEQLISPCVIKKT